MTSLDVGIGNSTWGHWCHVFQGANVQWLFDQRIRAGNFFNGLQALSSHMFDAQIPPGEVIQAATFEVEARDTQSGAMTIPINTPFRDNYYQEPLLLPFDLWEGYRRDFWSNQSMGALSTTFTAIAGAASAPANTSWIMSQIASPGSTLDHRQTMAQLTPTRTGNMEIAFIFYELFRTGNPVGSLRVRIQGVTQDQYGQDQPDGIDIAVTDDVLASSVGLGPAVDTIGFTFTTNPTLVAETDYFWIIEHDYDADNANHISVRHHNAFFNNGRLFHYGEGLGGDWQNFPGTVDFYFGTQTPLLTTSINWVVPNFVANTKYTSPDITAIVQAQVNAPWYTQDSGIIITCGQPGSGLVGRTWKSGVFPDINEPRLFVTFRDRRIMLTC